MILEKKKFDSDLWMFLVEVDSFGYVSGSYYFRYKNQFYCPRCSYKSCENLFYVKKKLTSKIIKLIMKEFITPDQKVISVSVYLPDSDKEEALKWE